MLFSAFISRFIECAFNFVLKMMVMLQSSNKTQDADCQEAW